MMIDLNTQSIRAQILQKIAMRCESLLALLPNDGDIEPQIFWARQQLLPDELPAAVVTPEPESGDRSSYGSDLLTMPVTISLVCLIGLHNAVDLAEYLLAEMKGRIPLDDQTFDGLAQDIRFVQGGVNDYPDEDEQGLSVFAVFEIDYETEINNPDKGV